MKPTQVQESAIKELGGNTNYRHFIDMLVAEEETLTNALVSGPADVGKIARLQGSIIVIQEILKLNKP